MGLSWTRVGTWAVAAVIGIVYGIAGTVGQAMMWGVLPLGLLVATIGVGALLVATRLMIADRWASLAAGMGMMIATLVFSGAGPGGSVIVPAPTDGEFSTGIVWTFVVPVLTAIVVGWPSMAAPRPRVVASAPDDQADSDTK